MIGLSSDNVITGIVSGYKRGLGTQYPKQAYVVVNTERKRAYSLVGCKVRAQDHEGNIYIGKVVKVIGSRNPKLLVVFRRNLPGQMIGKTVFLEAK